jgi:Ca2+-binding RTX toxin-like protein
MNLLYSALTRSKKVYDEIDRVNAGIPSGSTAPAAQAVAGALVEATHLDYQLAVLAAGANTQSYRTDLNEVAYDAANDVRHQKPALANFYDVYGSVPPSAVSNSQWHYGARTPVWIEDQPLIRGDAIDAAIYESLRYADGKLLVPNFSQNDFGDTHSLVLLVDSLSVQNMLATLDPNVEIGALNRVLQAASNAKAEAVHLLQGKAEGDVLENILNSLGRIFRGPNAPVTIGKLDGGTWADPADRNIFYNNLKALQDSQAFKDSIGRVTLVPTAGKSSLPVDARTDFASFLSLLNLSPFVLKSNNATDAIVVEGTLAANWGSLRTDWITDKNAVAAGQAAENYTDVWLSDRQALLQWQMVRNLSNVATGDPLFGRTTSEIVNYDDNATNLRVQLRPALPAPAGTYPARYVTFGSATNETLSGAGQEDHLYGGAGADTLNGQGGSDYLEGNADNDALDGGDGNDTLLGGAGNDILDGGIDSDQLKGGLGSDTYNFAANWGADTIEDAGGQGSLNVAGLGPITGSGAAKVATDAWQTPDKQTNYTLVNVGTGRDDLIISFSDRTDTITIRNWSAGQLGINLAGTVAPPVTSSTLTGDFIKKLNPADPTRYLFSGGNYVADGVDANANDVITGSGADETLQGNGGHDALAGLGGADLIDGGEGNDLLLGGSGADTLNGGAGIDFIFGSGAGGLNYLVHPSDQPPVAPGPEVTRGFAWVTYDAGLDGNNLRVTQIVGADPCTLSADDGNLIDGGAGDDSIDAGSGADTVHGGADNDKIYGLAGADKLFGDAGDDNISGDGLDLAGYLESVPGSQHGDDLIAGGAGKDTLSGQGGDDQIYGGTEDDQLWGDDTDPRFTPYANHGDDYLDGGDGADQLVGGGKDDMLIGGIGNDALFGDGAPDNLPGQYHGEDYLEGGAGNDYLEGGGRDDALFGGADDDTLWGDASSAGLQGSENGVDYLEGEAGNDSLIGGGKGDTLIGGEGNDYLQGDGTVVAVEDAGDDLLDGGNGNDILEGNGGNDELLAGAGDDVLRGGAGNDTLNGGDGTDVMLGGAGDDTYIVASGSSPLDAQDLSENISDTEGQNTIVLDGAMTSSTTVAAFGNGTLEIKATPADSLLIVNGAAVSGNSYQFSDGRTLTYSQLVGELSDTATTATDAQGRQHALGGRNNDSLVATAAFSTLSGGRGSDTLSGSGGNNTYLFGLGDGSDTVTDTSAKNINGVAAPNRIVFGAGIASTDIRLSHNAGALRLQIGGNAADSVTLGSFDTANAAAPTPIDNFVFADGTVLSYAQLIALGFDGTAGNDDLSGTALDDPLRGAAGDDTLRGLGGNDVLDGGARRWYRRGGRR